jgi:hypothetical protein
MIRSKYKIMQIMGHEETDVVQYYSDYVRIVDTNIFV